MSWQRMSPQVRETGVEVVPVFPKGRAPRGLAWAIVAFALLPALLALVDGRIGFRLLMGSLALVCLTVGVGVLVMFGAVGQGSVRVRPGGASLRFGPPLAATLPVVVMAFSLLLPAIAQLAIDTAGLPTMAMTAVFSRAPYVLGILGVAILVVQAWRMRVPAGLELTPEGLRGIRGAGVVAWTWEELVEAKVVAAPAAKLCLVPKGGAPVMAQAMLLGSDPNQVAAIVRYFLRTPSERAVLLEGGEAAVRRAEAGLRVR
ncbi:hypothetical protein [Microbacterium sp. SORGH_AS_0888]|uniref:hypothetical protein n=1 Tax=Microbacterium sp. SORGH_AS_0888 TaxID=3041791 RepID=UPI002787836F|nr:hypothetical protein [Microbacterium sp. SORGH_AS_0888]MDQ1131121.1 hypothetical protein [Microbacterium sp. SORGH_AS_0888]